MEATTKRPLLIAGAVAGILLIPFLAMQFTSEVSWNAMDFVIAAILLLGAGSAVEIILRLLKTRTSRLVAGLLVFLLLAIIWAELAVGILGTPLAGS